MATSTGPAPNQPVRSGINLLDNWYFIGGGSQQGGGQLPINQRGQTSYTGASYMIDRWGSTQGNQYIRIGNNCITLGLYTTNHVIGQTVKNLPAGTYIFSALISRSTKLNSLSTPAGYWITNFYAGTNSRLVSAVYTTDSPVTNARFGFCGRGDSFGEITEIDVIATKLELGDTQTLAHQENGVWVLNDPQPNYDMELLKCQLSTADSSDTYANKKIQFVTT